MRPWNPHPLARAYYSHAGVCLRNGARWCGRGERLHANLRSYVLGIQTVFPSLPFNPPNRHVDEMRRFDAFGVLSEQILDDPSRLIAVYTGTLCHRIGGCRILSQFHPASLYLLSLPPTVQHTPHQSSTLISLTGEKFLAF